MKKIMLIMCVVAATLVSCDDNAKSTSNTQSIAGNYVLTSLVSDVAVDLDQDGTSDTQLMNETTCFDTVAISFDANGNFTTTVSEVGFDANNVLTCSTIVTTGTYTFANSVLTITTAVNGGSVTESKAVLLTATTLEIGATDTEVAQYFTNSPGTPASAITQIDAIYTKI